MLRPIVLALALCPAFALLPAASALAQAEAKPSRVVPEPEVKEIVVEDDNARIDELRVRGLTKSITVHPKKGGPNYEIRPLTPTANPPNSADGARTAGTRVWNVLAF